MSHHKYPPVAVPVDAPQFDISLCLQHEIHVLLFHKRHVALVLYYLHHTKNTSVNACNMKHIYVLLVLVLHYNFTSVLACNMKYIYCWCWALYWVCLG